MHETPLDSSSPAWVFKSWTPRAAGAGAVSGAGTSLVERVLSARGMIDPAERERFCAPTLGALHDPSLIPGLDDAADRLFGALDAGEPIVIFGDYDVDGITATAILYHTLRAVRPDARVSTYVPHRLDEGYGLNDDALRALAADGARVIVTVDCGVTAVGPAQTARELGIDLIITDHHNPPESDADLPDAFAVVHPRRPGSAYPFGELCGAGVAYKLAWRLATRACGSDKVSPAMRTVLVDLLSLCALGTIADVVPLVDENRAIVKFGLARIRSVAVPGMRELIEAAGLSGERVDAEAVGFRLAPRLNACGRMGHARDAVELFTTAAPARATQIAELLCKLNDERRATERRIADQAAEMAQDAGMTGDDRRAIVLAHPEWHPGVIGIVCSRLVERFHRPTVLLQDQGDRLAGSGRSVEGYSLHGGLLACADHLSRFGGHDMAAGLALDRDRLDAFIQALTDHANASLTPEDLRPRGRYDCDAAVEELTPRAVEQLESLAPFGPGNPSVKLRVWGRLLARPEAFGKTGTHLSFTLGPQDTRNGPGRAVRAIAWRWAEHAGDLPAPGPIEMIVSPKISRWNGSARVEPVVEDIAPACAPDRAPAHAGAAAV